MIDLSLHGGGFGGSKELIKSIQYVQVVLERRDDLEFVAIEPVNPDTSIVSITNIEGASTQLRDQAISVVLINDNALEISRYDGINEVTVELRVIEFYSVKSLQQGYTGVDSRKAKEVGIEEVSVNRSILVWSSSSTQGMYQDAGNLDVLYLNERFLTIKNNSPVSMGYYWQIVEFQ